MSTLREWLAKTPLKGVVQCCRHQMRARQWTARDQDMHDFYAQFVSAGELFFDVGANMGNRTKIVLRLGANVVAVEPQADCVRVLKKCYSGSNRLAVVQRVLGPSEGQAEIMVGEVSTLTTLSHAWLASVKASGRFQDYSWSRKQAVTMTTLDKLIQQHGMPAFIKIDVEGYEYEVLSGLTRPVRALSIEFTPEYIASTFKCIDHLQGLGDILANYSIGESLKLVLPEWVPAGDMHGILSRYVAGNSQFGDVYVKFKA